jgi:hypothetical protein
MLKPMCQAATWVNITVPSCHQAPSSTPGSQVPAQVARSYVAPPTTAHHPLGRRFSRSTSRLVFPPVARIESHTPALTTMIAIDVTEALVGRSPP